jgi:hypothetical protein
LATNDGVPILGFTWYSLIDQVDWDIALREQHHRVNPRGLFDLDRNVRPVGETYRQLIADWGEVLPTRSVCLRVPLITPQSYVGKGDPLVAPATLAAKRAATPTEGEG